ncbi:MAG: RtcB family protein [Candidatus Fermentibacteraceae bacterium]|nr:RtcB family protein [Candidatus Fermentibacteraceae bacterium]
MKRIDDVSGRIPVLYWGDHIEETARRQAIDLSRHSRTFHHVAIMADCHPGYGMPIGGVIACLDSVIPYAVGVDIGCGMAAVRTGTPSKELSTDRVRDIVVAAERRIPAGEGHSHGSGQEWDQFSRIPEWMDGRGRDLAERSLGTLGGGNHFLELQEGDDGFVWLMIHSGSRNTGFRTANHHHEIALKYCRARRLVLPTDELSYLPVDSSEGREYIRDMEFAMDYAGENRRRLIGSFMELFTDCTGEDEFHDLVDIHHNYAARETHFGREVWIHRKGATSARKGETGIIPGSMGTSSYIVRGLGNPDSFSSCSHGAGRTMGRREASRRLSVEECDESMKGVVFTGWRRFGGYGRRKKGAPVLDLSEAPGAYKDIEEVMSAQRDLVEPAVRLRPMGVVKG